jgi:tRNA synthetase class II core domain (G, H, P, S and T)
VRDAIGRKWQCSTVQLDFNLPQRFDMKYTDSDSTKKQPIMVHRAIFGSIERFFGILIENYAGEFLHKDRWFASCFRSHTHHGAPRHLRLHQTRLPREACWCALSCRIMLKAQLVTFASYGCQKSGSAGWRCR